MAKVISLITQKGGAGKTASTNALTVCLKHKGYRVLCVDFDPQGYLSFSMGVQHNLPTIYDVLRHTVKCTDAIQHTEVADVLPADGILGNFTYEFNGPGSEQMLRNALEPVQSLYDYILIDSPPELGAVSVNAIIASNVVLIPGLSDGYSLQGVIQVHETISRIKQTLNPSLVLGGMFLVRYYPREELSKTTWETAKLITQHLNMPLLETRIRHSNIIGKVMTILQCDMIRYAPHNNVVKDYIALTDELFRKGVF